MSRITEKFKQLKKLGQKALITYITAGDPSLAVTEKLVHAIEAAGADIIELGVPFSDPLADGPTIQSSHLRALKNDVSLSDVLKMVKKIRKTSEVPLVLMLSYNLIVKYGITKFVSDAALTGVDGIIPPDLSHEETGELITAAGQLDTIFLVAPTSTDERISSIAKDSKGFVYLVSLAGVTGARGSLPSDIKGNVARIRKYSSIPVAVGFGISTPEHVRDVCSFADGAIVGSAIVKIIGSGGGVSMLKKVSGLVRSLKKATNV
jgi:tryptophan synthase alpha chain